MRYRDSDDREGGSTIILLLALLLFFALSFFIFIYFMGNGGILGDREDPEEGDIGVNVTTGKVKIDIIDIAGFTLLGDALEFIDSDADGEVLFHPGAIFRTEGFKVKNTGDITVTYRAYISENTTFPREDFEKAFDVWITNDPQNFENAQKLTEFQGELQPGEVSSTYYLVVRMYKEAGNEYQTKTYSGIGITVNATQKVTEE